MLTYMYELSMELCSFISALIPDVTVFIVVSGPHLSLRSGLDPAGVDALHVSRFVRFLVAWRSILPELRRHAGERANVHCA